MKLDDRNPLVVQSTPFRPLWLRIIYAIIGIFFVILGIIGSLLPIIPGFVFVLIAIPFLAKAYPPIGKWLHQYRIKIQQKFKKKKQTN